MSNEIPVPITESTKPLVLKTINKWLVVQEDYLKDFLFIDFKLVDGNWSFITRACVDTGIKSDMQGLTDRMCKQFGYQVLR